MTIFYCPLPTAYCHTCYSVTMRTFEIAIVASALSDSPREVPNLAREAGFAGVQFDAYSPSLRIPDLSITGRREFRQTLDNQNQKLVGLRVDLGPLGFGPGADVDRLLNGLGRAMEAATGLASPLVCVDLGPLPEPPRVIKPKSKVTSQQAGLIVLPESIELPKEDTGPELPPTDPAFVSQVDAALGELGALADRYSTMLAFRTDLASFAAMDEVLRRVGCPWFVVDLDPAAMLRDVWPIDDIFTRLGQSIRHVRGRDASKGADRRTKPAVIGRGTTDWSELLSNLDGAGYAGWITIDPMELNDRRASATAGLTKLKSFS